MIITHQQLHFLKIISTNSPLLLSFITSVFIFTTSIKMTMMVMVIMMMMMMMTTTMMMMMMMMTTTMMMMMLRNP